MRIPFTIIIALIAHASFAIAADPPKPLFTVSKETTILTAPLKDDGRPDYVAYINAQLSKDVTPDNNGFALWLQIIGTDDTLSPVAKEQVLAIVKPEPANLPLLVYFPKYAHDLLHDPTKGQTLEDTADALSHKLWKRADCPEFADYLDKYDAQLTLITQAAGRPHWYSPYIGKSCVAMLIPSLGAMRYAARTLDARAMLHARAGDFPAFLRDITAARQLSRHLSSGPTIIEMVVAASMEKEACEAEAAVVAGGTLTTAQIADLQKADRHLASMCSLWPVVDQFERWSVLDCAMIISLSRGKDLDGMLGTPQNPVAGIDPADVDWDFVLKLINQVIDQQVGAFKFRSIPLANAANGNFDRALEQFNLANAAPPQKLRGESREDYSARVAGAICSTFCGSFGRANMLEDRAILEGQMLTVLLAAARYKSDNNAWPARLDDLVPDYTPVVPSDPFARDSETTPLHYLITTTGILIYSVGENGKDDGGVFNPILKADDIVLGIQEKLP